jgi:plasmid maintenance system antidote protein VapI
MSDSERITLLSKHLGLSINKLAAEIELKSAQTLYDIKKGKHGISKDVAEKIKHKWNYLSMIWLLTGEGDMLNDLEVENKKVAGKVPESDSNGIGEPAPEYGSKRSGDVSIPREILELLNMQAETIRSQQRTIEKLEAENKKINAQPEDNVGFADVG